MKYIPVTHRRIAGFSLIEMAIVMLVIGLLVGGLLVPLTAQIDQQRTNETQKSLAEVKEALIGFALVNGRLPCPASDTSNGVESFCTGSGICGAEVLVPPAHGRCFNPYGGFVPAVTLGVAPISAQGKLLDAWANPVRYAITNAKDASNIFYFTATPDGIKTRWNSGLSLNPDLYVCASASTSASFTSGTDCGGGTAVSLTTNGVAVIYSLGKNAATVGTGADEAANLNGDKVFVSHLPSPATSPNGEFDDIVTWLSPNILYNRMVAAGRLP